MMSFPRLPFFGPPLKHLLQKAGRAVACKPELYYRKTESNRRIVEQCSLLNEVYYPTPYLLNGHLQTVFGTILRQRYPIKYAREILNYPDGGDAALDWDSGKGGNFEREFDAKTPILLVVPGLAGGSHSKYLRHFVLSARQAGLRSCVANYRGFGGIPAKTPMVSTSFDVSDVLHIVKHLREQNPGVPILAAGFSLGANILTKFLGLYPNSQHGLLGAVAVSNAFDFPALCESLEKPLNNLLYSRPLTLMLRRNVFLCPKSFAALSRDGCDLNAVLRARTIKEVDDRLCSKLNGASSVEEYYEVSSSLPHVANIDTPLLCINAKDDPFEGCIPYKQCAQNAHVILAVTNRGGHVNFRQGLNLFSPNSSWMDQVSMQYLDVLVKKEGNAGDGDSKQFKSNYKRHSLC